MSTLFMSGLTGQDTYGDRIELLLANFTLCCSKNNSAVVFGVQRNARAGDGGRIAPSYVEWVVDLTATRAGVYGIPGASTTTTPP
mmetsp:Transcript_31706/g.30222  ORF Transcript_31706/g.30222 Transcript_31706/m.30222 type:complete len:85 (+) Transcript_31706:174-428(+)